MEFRASKLWVALGFVGALLSASCNQYAYREGSNDSTLDDGGFLWPDFPPVGGSGPTGGPTGGTGEEPPLVDPVSPPTVVAHFSNFIQYTANTTIVPYLRNATELYSGFAQNCVKYSNEAYCWGDNRFFQLGIDNSSTSTIGRATPAAAVSRGYRKIAFGERHSCFIDSVGAVRCFGGNFFGELGFTATNSTHRNAIGVQGMSSNVSDVSAGFGFTCAIRGGYAYCWGKNDRGQLGNLQQVSSAVPQAVSMDRTAVSLASTRATTCALRGNGSIRCWGENEFSQTGRGDGNREFRYAVPPAEIGDREFRQVVAGSDHFCALTTRGDVWCWGLNSSGQLGTTPSARSVPRKLSNLPSGITKLVAGGSHTCALNNDGVYCWGSNKDGQLGVDRGLTQVIYPVRVDTFAGTVVDITAGTGYTCALISGGMVRCFGAGFPHYPARAIEMQP